MLSGYESTQGKTFDFWGGIMDRPMFYKAKRFFPTMEYEKFSNISDKKEIVTFDILCEKVEVAGVDYDAHLSEW